MARQDLRPRSFEHLRVLHRLLDAGEDAELGRDGDGEVLVEGVYCKPAGQSRFFPQEKKTGKRGI
jgi:hypothetical protein